MLVENIENPKGPAVVRPIGYKVIRPDVIAVCRPQSEARPIGAPEPSALGLLRWLVEAFLPPDRSPRPSPRVSTDLSPFGSRTAHTPSRGR